MEQELNIQELKIGTKNIANYIYAILKTKVCVLRARGSNLKKAVDVALIAERDYGYSIRSVNIYDTKYEDEEHRTRHVSNIDISLSK